MSIFGDFVFGSNVILNSSGIDLVDKSKIVVSKNATLKIGDYSGMSQTSLWCKNSITIGRHVDIGAGCLIIDSDFHNTDWKARENRSYGAKTAATAPITIEDNVFIGARCIICKGVTIGARSIVAAGSVVSKDIPADCLAGGNPCKIIKNLTNKNV